MDQNFQSSANGKVVDLDKEKMKRFLKYIIGIMVVFIVALILFNAFTFSVGERSRCHNAIWKNRKGYRGRCVRSILCGD